MKCVHMVEIRNNQKGLHTKGSHLSHPHSLPTTNTLNSFWQFFFLGVSAIPPNNICFCLYFLFTLYIISWVPEKLASGSHNPTLSSPAPNILVNQNYILYALPFHNCFFVAVPPMKESIFWLLICSLCQVRIWAPLLFPSNLSFLPPSSSTNFSHAHFFYIFKWMAVTFCSITNLHQQTDSRSWNHWQCLCDDDHASIEHSELSHVFINIVLSYNALCIFWNFKCLFLNFLTLS